jgi:hypothetical protein
LIQLIPKEDCSSTKKAWAKKETTQEKGWTNRSDKHEGDKRSNCKYYDIEKRSCSVYKDRNCYGCKKKNFKKMTPRQKGYLKRYEKHEKI